MNRKAFIENVESIKNLTEDLQTRVLCIGALRLAEDKDLFDKFTKVFRDEINKHPLESARDFNQIEFMFSDL